MNRRGQGMQFSLTFAMFAGVILLLLFAMFAFKYIGLQEKKESVGIGRNLNNLITSARGNNQYLVYNPDIPDFDLQFSLSNCGEFWINNYMQVNTYDTLFGSSSLGNDYVIWSTTWDEPYEIASLIYISPSDRSYYFSDGLGYLETKFSGHFNVVDNANGADVVVVSSSGTHSGREIVVGTNQVNLDGRWYNAPSVEFVYGAIFAESATQYNCNYEMLLSRFEILKNIYRTKAQSLAGCNYNEMIMLLDSMAVDNYEAVVDENYRLSNFDCEVVF